MSDLLLGVHTSAGVEAPFFLSEADRLHHVYVAGMSGTGKSTLLMNMLIQEIAAGGGCAFFDAHGEDAEKLLGYVPRHRIDDVLYLDAADPHHSVAFNILFSIPPDRRHLVVDGFVESIEGIWPKFFGPRMEDAFKAALAALLECEHVSLLGLLRMLSDEQYRRWVVKQASDPIVRQYWARFESYDRKLKAEIVAPIENKVRQLLLAPQLRNILGQVKSRIDLRDVMDSGKIFVVNLSKGKLGRKNANLLGSLLLSQLQVAAMGRADVPHYARRNFTCYVDEFQSFVTNSFASTLSEARKYRFSLVLANQYLKQLDEQILNAVFGNVGTIVAFRVGAADAEIIQKQFGKSYGTQNLTTLANREVCVKLLSHGYQHEPFLGRTHPIQGRVYGWRDRIIKRSRERYGVPRRKIEDKVRAWLKVPN
jgi:hypothetical protein